MESKSERGLVPESMAHLTESAVEQFADGLLAGEELDRAEAHVQECAVCAAHVEASRALIDALSTLPRFAPSPGFADLVMANIQVTPRASPVFAWIRHWAPETRRGWTLLVAALLAPMLPLIALTAWVASSPVVTAPAVIQWSMVQMRSIAGNAGATLTRWGLELGLPGWFEGLYQMARGVPLDALIVTLIILAVAIPLSAWSLVRLVRTPTGNVTYAN
jgi:hypothetical protein